MTVGTPSTERPLRIAVIGTSYLGANTAAGMAEFGFDADNLPMKPMSVVQCVDEGLAALGANRATHITGCMFPQTPTPVKIRYPIRTTNTVAQNAEITNAIVHAIGGLGDSFTRQMSSVTW